MHLQEMDCRVKPGNDGITQPARFGNMAGTALPSSRARAAEFNEFRTAP
jgi:hypothetical protein